MTVNTRSSSRTPTQRNESTPAAERAVGTVPIQEESTDFAETITDQPDDKSNFQTTEKGRQTMDTILDEDNEIIRELLKKEQHLKQKLREVEIQKRIQEMEAQLRKTQNETYNNESAPHIYQEVDDLIRQETRNVRSTPEPTTEIKAKIRDRKSW
ncbi:hypothetical protein CNMCM7691_004460 [Aspergillus felis]|uniref:Uncharacterized protein n=1 Tax=Aspergillus felis TaxID=1287682 RepID=A0A8H6VAG7_9EURO|nr:hypothetical protein CNMCM7691_004460 [Aspergillus felis]